MTVVCRVTHGKLRWSEVEPTGYHIGVTCGGCGADLEPVTEGKVIHNAEKAGTETSAIARCSECRRDWHLWVRLVGVAGRREGSACGEAIATVAGYQRHVRAGQPACEECLRTHVDAARPKKKVSA